MRKGRIGGKLAFTTPDLKPEHKVSYPNSRTPERYILLLPQGDLNMTAGFQMHCLLLVGGHMCTHPSSATNQFPSKSLR